MRETIYIAGPMTGIEDFNHPAFHHAEHWLQTFSAADTINPAKNFDGDTTLNRSAYIRKGIAQVLRSTSVLVLDGWEKSEGARLEVAVALECDIPVFAWNDIHGERIRSIPSPSATPEPIEEEARRIVGGVRNTSYDEPEDNFGRIGRKWGANLDAWRASGDPAIPPELVALMMVDLKTTREAFKHGRDNLVDAIGYVLCLDTINERKAS